MAYSSIAKPGDHFNTVLYTGNGSTQSVTGVGFQPDWVWIKGRSVAAGSNLSDAVSGVNRQLQTASSAAEETLTTCVTAFDSNGFSLGSNGNVNTNSATFVAWNWLAGGTAPAITYVVKVVSDSGNKYRFDDFGTSAVTLDLQEGGTYTFDQSDSSNSGHPLRFYTASDKSGGEYTTGVTTTGTPGSSGAQTVITVAASAPTLYYQCSNHAGMGGQANTNSTFGSSNFSGSIQSTVSANTTAGFSVVKYTGTGANATIGHGLGVVPKMIIVKAYEDAQQWAVQHSALGATKGIRINTTAAAYTSSTRWNNTEPTSSVFTVGTEAEVNTNTEDHIAYCLAEKKGYSKIGSYTGNGNADGTFVYTGFRPAWILLKQSSASGAGWRMHDNKRGISGNPEDETLYASSTNAESTGRDVDFLSNGFKLRTDSGDGNSSSSTYIYLAFAENPFVANDSGTAVPVVAR